MPIDDLFAANRAYLRSFRGPIPEVLPRKKLAVVACIDNRLVGVLPPALGLATGDAMLIRVAGVQVTPTQQSIVRSVAASIYFSGVREVAVVGHTDCRMAVTEGRAIEAMKSVGVDPEQACAGRSPRQVLGLIPSAEEAVRDTVEALRLSPLIPGYIEIFGLILDSKSAELTEVTRSPAMGTPPEEIAVPVAAPSPASRRSGQGSAAPVTIGGSAGSASLGASNPWADSHGSLLGGAASGDAFSTAGPIGPIGPSTPLGSGSSSSGASGVDAFLSLGSTSAFIPTRTMPSFGGVTIPEPPPSPPSFMPEPSPSAPRLEPVATVPLKDPMKELMDSMTRAVKSALTPPSPSGDEEIPTAILLDEPAPAKPATARAPSVREAEPSAKTGFAFDKDELRRRRDEKIKRIIKGS